MPARRAIPTVYNGVRYRSKFEVEVARQLAEAANDWAYERDSFTYELPCMYTPDFVVEITRSQYGKFDRHHLIYIEVKGQLTPADRRKMIEVKRAHPHLDLRILFQRASTTLSKAKRSMSYGTWATAHGFPWAEKTIPEEWLR